MRDVSSTRRTARGARRAAPPPPPNVLERYRLVLLLGAVLVGIAAIAFVATRQADASWACASLLTPPPDAADQPLGEGFVTQDLGRNHVTIGTRIEYGFCPPTSGPHHPAPLARRFYGPDDAVAPG